LRLCRLISALQSFDIVFEEADPPRTVAQYHVPARDNKAASKVGDRLDVEAIVPSA
jgi:hypothetical protein